MTSSLVSDRSLSYGVAGETAPLVSVIVIAKKHGECAGIEEALLTQSCKDFELVTEVGGTIPEAWNRAIARARGQYIVFTETDARPMHNDWLEQLVGTMSDGPVMVKGVEINHTPWNLCNTIVRRDALDGVEFDESFTCAEDTEFFSHLHMLGYRLEKRLVAPVMHSFDPSSRKALSRAYRYGVNWMRIRHRYQDPVEAVSFSWLFRRLWITILQIIGMTVGWFLSFTERRIRQSSATEDRKTNTNVSSGAR